MPPIHMPASPVSTTTMPSSGTCFESSLPRARHREAARAFREEFGAFVKEDIARWAKRVKATGAKLE